MADDNSSIGLFDRRGGLLSMISLPPWDSVVLGVAGLITAIVLVSEVAQSAATAAKPPVLKSLAECSTDELRQADRTADVAIELLCRDDVDPLTANAALRRLAAIKSVSPAKLLAEWILQLDKDSSLTLRRNLVSLVSQLEPAAKKECGETAERLAATAASTVARQTALAARMTAERNSAAVFAEAKRDANQLADFLRALPLVPDNSVQRQAWRNIRPLLDSDQARSHGDVLTPQLQTLVLRIIVQWEGDEAQKAGDAMRVLCSGQCQVAAMEALVALPTSSWPEQQLGQTAAAVIAWLAENPQSADVSPDHTIALNLCRKLGPRFSETKRTRFENRLSEISEW